MKNIIKSISLLLVLTMTVSCDSGSGDDLGYAAQEERGWVQFLEDSPSEISVFLEEGGAVELDVNIQVPTTSSDLSINYNLVSVAGDDPNNYFSNTGSVIAPAGKTSYAGPDNDTGFDYTYLAMISLDLAELNDVVLTGPMVFDVVLTGTSSSQISAGLEGETFKVTQRIVILQIASLAGTYSVTELDWSWGDYWGESYQVEVAQTDNPLELSVTDSDGFPAYCYAETSWLFGNGECLYDDSAPGPWAYVSYSDYFVHEPTDYSVGYDASGNVTVTFGTLTGDSYFNAGLTYSVKFTKL